MVKLKAYWLRFWHCLFGLKPPYKCCMVTITTKQPGKITKANYIGCDCGKFWYKDKMGEILLKKFKTK